MLFLKAYAEPGIFDFLKLMTTLTKETTTSTTQKATSTTPKPSVTPQTTSTPPPESTTVVISTTVGKDPWATKIPGSDGYCCLYDGYIFCDKYSDGSVRNCNQDRYHAACSEYRQCPYFGSWVTKRDALSETEAEAEPEAAAESWVVPRPPPIYVTAQMPTTT